MGCAVRSAPPPAGAPRPPDLLLEGPAVLVTEGRAQAAPLLRRAAGIFAGEEIPAAERLRWSPVAVVAAVTVWDEESWHAIQARELQSCREAGLLAQLVIWVYAMAALTTWRGDFAAAASLIAEAEAIAAATGTRFPSAPAVVVGHSTGGLLAQMLAGRGLAAATVAIDPGVFRGVLPLPASVLRGVGPFLVNPRTRRRAITLTFGQFRYGWANALGAQEARELYDTFHVAGSGISLVQMGTANLNPRTEAKVNTTSPDRGPLLIIDGADDHTVPWAIAHAAYKRQRRNPAVTEIVKLPHRGHSLTIDHGWHDVAQTALDFIKRFAPPGYRPESSVGAAPGRP